MAQNLSDYRGHFGPGRSHQRGTRAHVSLIRGGVRAHTCLINTEAPLCRNISFIKTNLSSYSVLGKIYIAIKYGNSSLEIQARYWQDF